MSLPNHRMPHQDLVAIAADRSGIDVIRELTAIEHSKHMTFLCGVLATAEGSEKYPLARAGFDLLAAAVRENRDAAGIVIGYPSVGAWARRTVLASRGGSAIPGAGHGQLRAVAAAAAIRAGLRAQIEVPVTDGCVMLPSLGAAMVPGPSAVVRSGPGGATIGEVAIPRDPCQDASGWLGLRRFRAGPLDLLIDDLDPFRMPGMDDLAPRTQGKAWEEALNGAWRVLEDGHPTVAAEVAELVSAIVPRLRPPSGQVSTSSPEVFGAVALSLPPDPVTGAETLAHEMQHVKLGALLDVVTLTLPDDGRRCYAPWRDDPRPVGGLLQGTYAYLGVTGFWRRQRRLPSSQPEADAKYARWRSATVLAVDTLRSSGRLTRAGLDFIDAMADTLSVWQAEPVPVQAVNAARRATESHLAKWKSAHGSVPVG